MPATEQLEQLSPPPPQPRSPFGLGFRQPSPDSLLSDTIPNPASSPQASDELEQDSADEWDDLESELLESTSSPASTPVANPLDSEGLRDVFRGGVMIASTQAHNMLATTEGKQRVGLYLADEDDASNIGDPLARVAARHQGVGKINPDTADLLAAMVGLTRYATKQITKANVAKQLDGAAAGRQHAEPGENVAVDL